MKIKDVSRFLASASMLVCASFGMAGASHAHQGGIQLPSLKGVNLEGASVRMVSPNDLPRSLNQSLREQSGGGAMNLRLEDNSILCSVMTHQKQDAPGMPGTVYDNPSTEDSENLLMDRNVYDFYLAAHELSHCFNHASLESRRQIVALQQSGKFEPYVPLLHLINASVRETYADFSAVLLGASKTGDWTVFSKAVLPFRSRVPDLKHVTLNATANLINGIDPKGLKGMSFQEVNALANEHFRKRFMNAKGEIDLRSPGLLDVVSEYAFTGEHLRILSTIDVYEKDAKLFLTTSNLIRDFGKAVYKKPIAMPNSFAFISALHVVDAKGMEAFAKEDRNTATPAGRKIASAFVEGMQAKQRRERAIDLYMHNVIFRQKSELENHIEKIMAWQRRTSMTGAERLLGAKLNDLLAENLQYDTTDSLAAAQQGLKELSQGQHQSTGLRGDEASHTLSQVNASPASLQRGRSTSGSDLDR